MFTNPSSKRGMAGAASGAFTSAMLLIAVTAFHQNLSCGDSDSRRWPFFLPRGQPRAYTNIPDAIAPRTGNSDARVTIPPQSLRLYIALVHSC